MTEVEQQPNPDELAEYRQRLMTDFPDLEINSVRPLGQGWHHVALEVNNSLVFRVPRGVYDSTKLASSVSYETTLLRRMQGKLPVAIPSPAYIAPEDAYFGYSKLEGVLLRDLVPKFSKQDHSILMQDWVDIASAIHQEISVNEARTLNLPDFIKAGPSTATQIFDIPGVDQSVLAFAGKTIRDYESLVAQSAQYVVIHNDLQFHNMVADPISHRITGLIDWTDACIGPIAREFAINEWMQGDLLEKAAVLYEVRTGIKIDVQQARMWKHLEELSDYVDQVASGEIEGAAATLTRIKQLMR